MRMMAKNLGWIAACSLALGASSAAQDKWVIESDMLYTAAGDPIEGGIVVVAKGKIAAVGSAGGAGTKLKVAAVTPGLIDLDPGISTGSLSVEQGTEAALEYSVADGLDLFSYEWTRHLKSGVTSVMASPIDLDVIGGMCFVLKTGGDPLVESRQLNANPGLRASLGTMPSRGNGAPRGAPRNMYIRRPTTRMGVEWIFRKAFYNAINAKKFGLEVSERQDERNQVVMRTMNDSLPVFMQAAGTQDVHTAIFLKQEFGIQDMILMNAAEAVLELDLVTQSGVGVVLPAFPKNGRIPDPSVNDSFFMSLESAAKLQERGVRLALSGGGSRSREGRLSQQAGYAMRGGLSFEAALAAVTINPARMAGVDDRVGSIEVGKDADLVLWSGKPFEPSSAVIGVLLDGELILDPRVSQSNK
jgi:imidazolonepropionase-like amidohydrolase